jgi:hypothetical protein
MKVQKLWSLELKFSYTTNNLPIQFTHTTLCIFASSIILLSSLLCISN